MGWFYFNIKKITPDMIQVIFIEDVGIEWKKVFPNALQKVPATSAEKSVLSWIFSVSFCSKAYPIFCSGLMKSFSSFTD